MTETRLRARIVFEMAAQGLTAYALALRAKVGHATLARVLAGEGNPSWVTVQRLALALGVSLDSLRDTDLELGGKESRPRGRPRKA